MCVFNSVYGDELLNIISSIYIVFNIYIFRKKMPIMLGADLAGVHAATSVQDYITEQEREKERLKN
jgi:hypothetical protein